MKCILSDKNQEYLEKRKILIPAHCWCGQILRHNYKHSITGNEKGIN